MKILKNAHQNNFKVDTSFYSIEELDTLERGHIIDFSLCCYRVFTSNLKEVKVIYDRKYEMYCTVAVTNDDHQIYVMV